MNKAILLIVGFLLSFNVAGQLTYVPDDNFEQALIDLGVDDILDDFVLTSNIEPLTELSITYLEISDLTGIEDFVNLTSLVCHHNNLTTLNVQNLTALYILSFSYNQVTTIDLTNNVNLAILNGNFNNLTNIDLSQNTELTSLHLYDNQIGSIDISNCSSINSLGLAGNNLLSLDISQNILLENLAVQGNQLTELDVSNNTQLEALQCFANDIDSLDVSGNPELRGLWCYVNGMTYLDVRNGNNQFIDFFNSQGNPELTCILVDDAEYSTDNWEWIDESSTFVETQEECDLLLSLNSEELNHSVAIFPNPSKGILYIENYSQTTFDKIRVIDLIGKSVYVTPYNEQIDLTHLSNGLYILELETSQGAKLTKKLIKQ